jgi:hypothetical protein
MWATSDEFSAALLEHSRKWGCKVEVLYGGSVVETLSVVASGAVNFDDVAVRRALDLTFVDADGTLTPASAKDLLAPKGTEIRVHKGLYVGGAPEWVPLGVFGVEEPEVSAHDNGTTVKIRANDRVSAVKKRRFTAPYTIAKDTPTAEAIAAVVTSRLDVPVRAITTGHVAPEVVYDELSDPWDAVGALCEADAITAYFDPLGTLVIEPDDEVDTGIEYSPGANSLLVKSMRSLLADKTYSGVIVKGEHPDYPPVRYELWDTDPNSPTYADGPFGYQPYGFTSSLITSLDMATATAETIFARVTRMRQVLELETVGHPGHDVGDVVTVIDPKSRTNGRYVVYGGSIPLRLGTTRLKLREALT